MNGAEIVVKTLYKHGVRTVFGYPGGSILPVYDCLNGSKIRHILASHEQFACHAADGYARASGKTGVVMATSGPGATNLVTGIANAYMDSVPLIAITGNVPLDLLGHDAFQEIDIAGVTMPITKHNFIVKSVEDLAPTLCRAFQIAQSGRKGPVLIDIPTDIFYKSISKFILAPLPLKHIEISYSELETAAELINKSKFPFICVGGGVISSESSEKISLLADKCGAAVATTNMGKGGFPCSSSQYTGLVGMQINSDTIRALKNCDVFIAAGVRFSERLMKNVSLFAPKAKILHFDVDAAEIGKNAEIYRRVWGDIGEALDLLNPKIEQKQPWFTKKCDSKANAFYDFLHQNFSDAVFTTEVGLHQIDAANGLCIDSPRKFITSGGLGTMGFGLPAAIGASIATGKRVINIAGDGSFNMNIQEIMTAVRYKLPIIQIVINNRSLGMIEKWQNENFNGRIFESKTPEVNYKKIAEAMGANGFDAFSVQELFSLLEKAKKIKTPTVINWRTDL